MLRAGLAQRWSPEQIAGRRCRETGQRLSAETLYQYIARDKRAGGTLYRQLRYQGKPYRKKYGRTDYRGRIPGRVDIDQRPGYCGGTHPAGRLGRRPGDGKSPSRRHCQRWQSAVVSCISPAPIVRKTAGPDQPGHHQFAV